MAEPQKIHHRTVWAATRSMLETDLAKRQRNGVKTKRNWKLFSLLTRGFCFALKITGMRQRGWDNALNIALNEHEVFFDNLPQAFDGYSILFMSDLHLDSQPELSERIKKLIEDKQFDLCLLAGDYRKHIMGSYKSIRKSFREISRNIHAKDGILAILGNHDTYLMVEPMEKDGIEFLINEHKSIERNGEKINITGADDPYYYFTDSAIHCLEHKPPGFSIALVHTPELFDIAADHNYSLYLCGHTHGGQVCLPGGYPLITHLSHGRKFYKGFWKSGKMQGYTSTGTGTSGLSVRFNSQGEVVVLRLRRRE